MSGVTLNGVNMSWQEYLNKHKGRKTVTSNRDIRCKLINRLNNELDMSIPIETSITQLLPTPKQLSCGAFKWVFDGNFSRYGSTLSISELLRSDKLETSCITSGGLSTHPASLIDIQPA